MRRLLALPAALLAVLAWAAPRFGHAAYVGSEPAPGQRLEASPRARRARVHRAAERAARARDAAARRRRRRGAGDACGRDGQAARRRARRASWPRGAYRVDWHTVSTEDGHALEGAFSFGVRADAGAAPALETGPLARGGCGADRGADRALRDDARCSRRRCCCRC